MTFALAVPGFAMGSEDAESLETEALEMQPQSVRGVELYINASAVNLRTGPGTSYSQVVSGVTMNYGDYVVYTYNSTYKVSFAYDGNGGLWHYVTVASGPLSGYSGWVYYAFISSNSV